MDIRYANGHKAGYVDGNDIIFANGHKAGYVDGNDIMYANGHKAGYVDGIVSNIHAGAMLLLVIDDY